MKEPTQANILSRGQHDDIAIYRFHEIDEMQMVTMKNKSPQNPIQSNSIYNEKHHMIYWRQAHHNLDRCWELKFLE